MIEPLIPALKGRAKITTTLRVANFRFTGISLFVQGGPSSHLNLFFII